MSWSTPASAACNKSLFRLGSTAFALPRAAAVGYVLGMQTRNPVAGTKSIQLKAFAKFIKRKK